ncbi:MAG: hypothetical protein KF749_13320, partial [Bacteroidetes bacterium]|nr:hypothetical protein [Bacteroidota bacterium]
MLKQYKTTRPKSTSKFTSFSVLTFLASCRRFLRLQILLGGTSDVDVQRRWPVSYLNLISGLHEDVSGNLNPLSASREFCRIKFFNFLQIQIGDFMITVIGAACYVLLVVAILRMFRA